MSLPEFKTMLAEALRRIEGRLLPQRAEEGQVLVHGKVRPAWGDTPLPPDGSITLAKLAAAVQASLMPAGAVSGTAGTTAPTGWLMCDGSAVSTTTYAELYAAIGTTYNTQRNQSTGTAYSAPSAGTFRVPDYRGVFLRGVGTSSGYAATTLGATQDDATAKNGLTASTSGSDGTHYHRLDIGTGAYAGNQYRIMSSAVNSPSAASTTYPSVGQAPTTGYELSTHGHAITVGAGDSETRPVNVGINWMIKV